MRLLLLLCLCLPVLAQEAFVRQEILLEKAPAVKVMEFLAGQYKNVQFTPHPTMNGFYVYGSRKDVLAIKAEVPNLDRWVEPPPPPVRDFVPVRYGDINEMKALLATLVPDVEYVIEVGPRSSRKLWVSGSPGAIDQVKELVAELDREMKQVVIDCKVVDLTESNRKMLGLAGSLPPVSILMRTPYIITSNLQFLVTQSEAKVLAAPRVGTESGEAAVIQIGDRMPIVALDPVSGKFATETVEVGLSVCVLPTIRIDGYLDLKIDTETSALKELVSGQYACVEVSKDTHQLRVKDGDTVVLGGLIPNELTDAVNRIPLLADLPIMGTMFRSVSSRRRTKSEIVMMLTPHIMPTAR